MVAQERYIFHYFIPAGQYIVHPLKSIRADLCATLLQQGRDHAGNKAGGLDGDFVKRLLASDIFPFFLPMHIAYGLLLSAQIQQMPRSKQGVVFHHPLFTL